MRLPATLRNSASLIGFFLLTTSAAESRLEYKFQPGTTNGYRVTIDSASEDNPRRFEGIILVGVRSIDQNVATIFLRGRLELKPIPNAQRPFGGPMFHHPGPFGQPDPWFQFFQMSALPHFNEVQIDDQGRTLRTVGLADFPKPLENFATLLFPLLPRAPVGETNSTTIESTVVVNEDSSGRGPQMHGMFHPGMHGNMPGRLTGLRKETSRHLEPTNDLPRFSSETEFRSLAKTDGEPRLATKSSTEATLDPSSGLIHSLNLQANSIVSTLDVRRKSAVTVNVEKVLGAELARAINEAAERRPNLNRAEIDALLAQLKGDDRRQRTDAVQRLLAANLDQHAKAILPILLPFLNDNDHSLKMLAVHVLAKAATEEHLPILNRLLKQDDIGYQHEIIQALGRIGHKDSIQTLVDIVAYGSSNAHSAADALGKYGSSAEEATLALLKEKHLETRRYACQVLQRTGTSKSIEPLQAVIAADNPQLINEATEALRAIRAIRQRGEDASKLVF
jgi:hypothetical protein